VTPVRRGMAMSKDHYLPASLIARFSASESAPARKRRVIVAPIGRDGIFPQLAEDIGFISSLYTTAAPVTLPESLSVDQAMNGYEPRLPHTLNAVCNGQSITLEEWLRVLVPFVASLFVRGHDFKPRFESRPVVNRAMKDGLVFPDNTNGARLLEMNRLLALVICARWIVIHCDSTLNLITNDLGLTGSRHVITGETGWVIPINRSTAIQIVPANERPVAYWMGDVWGPLFEHQPISTPEVDSLNRSLAHLATRWIVGSDVPTVARYMGAKEMGPDQGVVVKDMWPQSHRVRLAHDDEWYRLVTVAVHGRHPSDLSTLQEVDVAAVARGFVPPKVVNLNTAEFPTGLFVKGQSIWLQLQDPKNYERYFYH